MQRGRLSQELRTATESCPGSLKVSDVSGSIIFTKNQIGSAPVETPTANRREPEGSPRLHATGKDMLLMKTECQQQLKGNASERWTLNSSTPS